MARLRVIKKVLLERTSSDGSGKFNTQQHKHSPLLTCVKMHSLVHFYEVTLEQA